MTGPARFQPALAAACARAGLDARDATVLHVRANAVYHLPRDGVVVRLRAAGGSPDDIMTRFAAAIEVTRWLRGQGFPAIEPVSMDQPLTAAGHVATFWRYVPVREGTGRDVTSLGQLIRALHSLPPPPVTLPAAEPLGSLQADVRDSSALAAGQRAWLLARASELERRYSDTKWVLGTGLLHGDAHVGNLLHAPDGIVLCDWDSVSRGPREMDLVPTSMWRRYGRPRAEWVGFCAAYDVSQDELPGLPLLQQLRELHALAAYIRNAADPAFSAELTKRITSLQAGTTAPWQAL
jgi:aminoglycoside phosphotransferase (APT) family kinase protein